MGNDVVNVYGKPLSEDDKRWGQQRNGPFGILNGLLSNDAVAIMVSNTCATSSKDITTAMLVMHIAVTIICSSESKQINHCEGEVHGWIWYSMDGEYSLGVYCWNDDWGQCNGTPATVNTGSTECIGVRNSGLRSTLKVWLNELKRMS